MSEMFSKHKALKYKKIKMFKLDRKTNSQSLGVLE